MSPTTESIISSLREIEEEKNVRILYACESGSRAWGFPSADSDYDVRFIFLRPVDAYLSIQRQPDVIEVAADGALDMSGWDLQKALLLLRKSNPPLLEWLGSPIIYLEEYSIAGRMRDLAARYYSSTASAYHYLHMARGNYREYLKGERVWLKKYFYVLRPILAVKWTLQGKGLVPTEFDKLVDGLVTDPVLKREIATLIQKKRWGEELDDGPLIPPSMNSSNRNWPISRMCTSIMKSISDPFRNWTIFFSQHCTRRGDMDRPGVENIIDLAAMVEYKN